MRTGATDVKLLKRSDDEFGRLTEGVSAMHQTLSEKDAVIAEKSRANEALLKQIFLPSIAERLKKGETQIVDRVGNVTVIYATIIGFVKETDALDSAVSIALLAEIFDVMDAIALEHGIERIKTFGEQYLAVCGLTVPRLDHAQRSVAFCDALAHEVARIVRDRGVHMQVRAALASGEINAGIVGTNRYTFDIWGKPLSITRRLIHDAGTDELRVSADTHMLLGPDSGFTEKPIVQGLTLGPMRSYGRQIGTAPAKIESPMALAAE
jgi:class 3 adenylate cyclase